MKRLSRFSNKIGIFSESLKKTWVASRKVKFVFFLYDKSTLNKLRLSCLLRKKNEGGNITSESFCRYFLFEKNGKYPTILRDVDIVHIEYDLRFDHDPEGRLSLSV